LKIGSTFSGIGALDLACEQAFGGHTIWQVEGIDPRLETPEDKKEEAKLRAAERHGAFNRHLLSTRFPAATQFADIRSVNFAQIERADVICGGFPCQDLSVAGAQAGLDGKRSGLYGQLMRAVWQQMPAFVVMENVAGLLKYEDRLNRELREMGYGAIWQTIYASNVGAPQQRKRVYVLAVRGWLKYLRLPDLKRNDDVRNWPTPKARDANAEGIECGMRRIEAYATCGLQTAAVLAEKHWPTPVASASIMDGESAASWQARYERNGKGPGTSLGLGTAARMEQEKHWPTPSAGNFNDGAKLEGWRARAERVAAYSSAISPPLYIAVAMEQEKNWPSPTAAIGTGGQTSRSGERRGELLLTGAVREATWPAPAARDYRSGTGRAADNGHTPQLPEVVGGKLNPDWVEMLMGLPAGWTNAAIPTSALGGHDWPAGRGDAQHAFEPPRLVATGACVPDRAFRLRSCGNGVVWQQALFAIRRALDVYSKG
jgi:site-specific DNA-cytosine methylase